MEWLEAGNGISEEANEGARKVFEWMREHPDELRESFERDRREWLHKRRKALKYLRRIERGKIAKMPDGLTQYDVDRARSELSSISHRREMRWLAIGKIANVAAIVGSVAAVATLVITIALGWFV